MAIDLGVMGAKVQLNTQGFDSGVSKIKRGFSDMGQSAMYLNQSLDLLTRGYRMLSTALRTVASPFLDAADKAEKYRVTLDILLGSTEEGARMFKEMAEFASTVPFEFDNIMSSATTLAGVLNGGVEEVKSYMPMIADLAAVARLSIEETTGQMVRMLSAGASAADMFRERGINAMLGFQSGVQYSVRETKEIMDKAYNSPISKVRGAADALAKTWTGTLSMISDQWFLFRLDVMQGGMFDVVKLGLNEFLQTILELKKQGKLDVWAKDMATSVITSFRYMAEAAYWFLDIINGIGLAIDKYQSIAYKGQLTKAKRQFDELSKLWEVANKNTLDNPLQAGDKTTLKEISDARDKLDKIAVPGTSKQGTWRQTGEQIAKLNAEIQTLTGTWGDNETSVIRGMERHEAMNTLMQRMNLTFDEAQQKIKDYNREAAAVGTGKKGPVRETPASKELTLALEAIKTEMDKLNFDKQVIGMTAFDKAVKDAEFSTSQLMEKYKETFAEDPSLEGKIDEMHRLRLAIIDAQQAFDVGKMREQMQIDSASIFRPVNEYADAVDQIDTGYRQMLESGGDIAAFAEEWRQAKVSALDYQGALDVINIQKELAKQEAALTLPDTQLQAELTAFQDGYDKMLEKGGLVAAQADQWKIATTALAQYRDMIGKVKEVTLSLVSSLSEAFAEFAATGKTNLGDLARNMVKELQLFAAQKTAMALMEATNQGIMALVAFAMKKDPSAHLAAAAAALSGAAAYAGFVAGSGIAGMAHDGITNIPEQGTWLLNKNERVVDADTNADLKDFLKAGGAGKSMNMVVNINGGDEQGVEKALPKMRQAMIDAFTSDYSSGGRTYQTVKNYS